MQMMYSYICRLRPIYLVRRTVELRIMDIGDRMLCNKLNQDITNQEKPTSHLLYVCDLNQDMLD